MKRLKRNIYLPRLRYATTENFTSPAGIKLRRLLQPLLYWGMGKIVRKGLRFHVFDYPQLMRNEPYIFASTHSFPDDVACALLSINRPTYLLTNSVDQLEINPEMYAAWLNGMIFVDTRNPQSRKQAIPKMQKVLANGSSVLVFPEGSWNKSENKLVGKLYPGTSVLAQRSGRQVVPLAHYYEPETREVYIRFGKPMDLATMTVEAGTSLLRDTLATLRYKLMEAHAPQVKRDALPRNARRYYRDSIIQKTLSITWCNPDWENEFRTYEDKDALPQDAWNFVDKLTLNACNARHLARVKAERQQERQYDVVGQLEKLWSEKHQKGPPG